MKQKKQSMLKLSAYMSVSMLLIFSMGIIDTFMLSIVSSEAVAAVGTVNILLQINFIVLNLVLVGAGILLVQYIGKKDYVNEKHTIASALTMTFFIGIGLIIFNLISSNPIIEFTLKDPELIHYANVYFGIVSLSFVFYGALWTFSLLMRSYNLAHFSMILAGITLLINFLLNLFFLYIADGNVDIAIAGIAFATLFSRFVIAIVSYFMIKNRLPFKFNFSKFWYFNLTIIKKSFFLSLWPTIKELVSTIAIMLVLSFVAVFGYEHLAAESYMIQVTMLCFAILIGILMANGIFIGKMAGAKEYARLTKFTHKVAGWLTLIMVGLAILMVVFAPIFFSYIVFDEAVLLLLDRLIPLYALLIIVASPSYLYEYSLQAVSDVKFITKTSVIIDLLFYVPLSYYMIVTMGLGIYGVPIAWMIYIIVRFVIFYIRLKSQKWQKHVAVHND